MKVSFATRSNDRRLLTELATVEDPLVHLDPLQARARFALPSHFVGNVLDSAARKDLLDHAHLRGRLLFLNDFAYDWNWRKCPRVTARFFGLVARQLQ